MITGNVEGLQTEASGVRRLVKTLRLALDLVSKAAPRELTVTLALTLGLMAVKTGLTLA